MISQYIRKDSSFQLFNTIANEAADMNKVCRGGVETRNRIIVGPVRVPKTNSGLNMCQEAPYFLLVDLASWKPEVFPLLVY